MIIQTPLYKMHYTDGYNHFYVKRDDLLPFSFGGNKYRKALLYFETILKKGYKTVVTVGSASSNHCRIIANLAKKHALKCYIVSPKESEKTAYNRTMTELLDAEIITPEKADMKVTIDSLIHTLVAENKKPFYIKLGGHGLLGTQAYKEAYEEIYRDKEYPFDYIFLATGTGTTQAGLVVGKMLHGGSEEIMGISVLSKYEQVFKHVHESILEYIDEHDLHFDTLPIQITDDYLAGGYGQSNEALNQIIKTILALDGIALDPVYTAKGFWGMVEHLKKQNIKNKKVLFIHTGGAPIFFDALNQL